MYDLLIKGGTIVDPYQKLHEKRDIAISHGLIDSLKKEISADQAKETMNAIGHIVTSGLVDLHVHVYPGVSHYGIDPDPHSLAQGVTTVFDAGSSGADTFAGFRRYVIDVSSTRIYALLNISRLGMISLGVGELEDIRYANVERAIEVIERNRDVIQGVKVRLAKFVVGKNGMRPLLAAKQVSEAVKMPMMVHPGNTSMPLRDILAEMRNKDILTHCFHGLDHGILDEHGDVLNEVREAVKRGVILDVGHGRGSFSFDVAERALSQGISPHTISSDLHYYNVFGPVYNLATTLSKFLYLGLSLDEALGKVTAVPASLLGLEKQLGTLKQGSIADISIFKLKEGNFKLEDTVGKVVAGNSLLVPSAVIKSGKIYVSNLRVTGR